MLIYWLMFLIPAVIALGRVGNDDLDTRGGTWGFAIAFVVFSVIIGLRFEIGADWFNYQGIVDYIAYADLGDTLRAGDPAFGLVTWISTRLGWDIYGPMVVCAIAMMTGILVFARRQADPWLSLAAAVPYLIIVVGMGYVRQAAAIGFVLLAILQFERQAFGRFFLWMSLAALFHISALILLPFAAVAQLRKGSWMIVPILLLAAALYYFLLRSRIDFILGVYVENEYDSSGALIRLLLNGVPALLYFIYYRRVDMAAYTKTFWNGLAAVSLLLIPIVGIANSTTIVDRIGLYMIPIQLLVFGNLTRWTGRTSRERRLVCYLVIALYSGVLFVWLNYAAHAQYWLPYRFLPAESLQPDHFQ